MPGSFENTERRSPGARFRELLEQAHAFLLPGVYDALSARMLERAGFPAMYLSGSAVAMSQFGLPDLGLVSVNDLITQAQRIAGASTIPLICDADTGFGNPLNVARTLQGFEAAGAAGIQLEDQTFPKRCGHFDGKQLVSQDEMVAKFHAACEAKTDPAFVIVARTDALAVLGLEAAIERALAYKSAGADVLFVEAPQSKEEMVEIARRLPGPLLINVVEGGRTPQLSFAEYEELGFQVVLYPTISVRVAARALESIYGYVRDNLTSAGFPGGYVSFEERNLINDLSAYQQLEARYAFREP